MQKFIYLFIHSTTIFFNFMPSTILDPVDARSNKLCSVLLEDLQSLGGDG